MSQGRPDAPGPLSVKVPMERAHAPRPESDRLAGPGLGRARESGGDSTLNTTLAAPYPELNLPSRRSRARVRMRAPIRGPGRGSESIFSVCDDIYRRAL